MRSQFNRLTECEKEVEDTRDTLFRFESLLKKHQEEFIKQPLDLLRATPD